jgi:hypothetical protein
VSQERIVVLPARNCRRSRKIVEYLELHGIPVTRIALESAEGRVLAEQHQMRASPGILIDDVSVNPLDLLIQPECRVDEAAARRVFGDLPSSEGNG